ncbi:MAG: cupin domain-containing protein [Pseudomonas sp.]|uniref:cupin domain-containing protein n=1 Tax=Pseudomonas sp. TaxID=306 RepID=UPI003BB499C9
MQPRVAQLIEQLQLQAHPEGGYYRRLFESGLRLPGGRLASSAIVFLLPAGQVSRWHRVDADELWHFYEGEPLELLIAESPAVIQRQVLGPLAGDCMPQRAVPAHTWQAARPLGSYSLVGCTLAPAFEFDGFCLLADAPAVQQEWPLLLADYPELL